MITDFSNERPIYLQILDLIKLDIISGKYHEGEKLPSVRELAASYRVNPNTMQRAFSELESAGLVFTERTNGRFVTEDKHVIAQLKRELAVEKVEEFLEAMKSLGYEDEELFAFIRDVRKEEKK
ncbi:GntR family transcriptional regulator [Amedibacillus sp. YH-ame10]